MKKVKINFSKLPCYVDIAKKAKMEVDVKYDFANIMYTQGSGIAMGALAMKIYNAQGEEEYNEQECNIIKDFAKHCSPILYDSILEIIEQKDNE